MFTKRVIPCLDVNEGRVVKGVNFVNLIDAGDPVSVGAAYGKAGADELVFLDITASSDAREIKANMVRKVADLKLPLNSLQPCPHPRAKSYENPQSCGFRRLP